jgi:hypothetical protein
MSGAAFRRRIAVMVVALLSVAGAGATAGSPESDPVPSFGHIHVTYVL